MSNLDYTTWPAPKNPAGYTEKEIAKHSGYPIGQVGHAVDVALFDSTMSINEKNQRLIYRVDMGRVVRELRSPTNDDYARRYLNVPKKQTQAIIKLGDLLDRHGLDVADDAEVADLMDELSAEVLAEDEEGHDDGHHGHS